MLQINCKESKLFCFKWNSLLTHKFVSKLHFQIKNNLQVLYEKASHYMSNIIVKLNKTTQYIVLGDLRISELAKTASL